MEELADKIYQGLANCAEATQNFEALRKADAERAAGTWVDTAMDIHLRENPHIVKWYAQDFFEDTHRDSVAAQTGLTGTDLDVELQVRWLDEICLHGESQAREIHAPLMSCPKLVALRKPPTRKKRETASVDLSTVPPAEMTVAQLKSELTRIGGDTRAANKPVLIARLIYERQQRA